jgi:hypothetical protein
VPRGATAESPGPKMHPERLSPAIATVPEAAEAAA